MLIQAENLTRYYGPHCAVNDISFTLAKGEILGFLGPNGAGKTTTMQMLCGNLAPSAGLITINGVDLIDQPETAKASLGYLPDTPPLYRELTVNEYLTYCARIHRITRNEIPHCLNRAKQRCGLDDTGDRLIANLSKGYQQRVGIAQAILHNPEIIILDEPTVGLDPIQILEIRSLIRELGGEHGIILSSHILPEIQESCTHVQIIHEGRLIFKETIEQLKTHTNTGSLRIATRKKPDLSLFADIPGVNHIDRLSDTIIRVHHNLDSNPAEAIAEAILAAGLGLQELTPEKRTLEEIFVNMTTGEQGHRS